MNQEKLEKQRKAIAAENKAFQEGLKGWAELRQAGVRKNCIGIVVTCFLDVVVSAVLLMATQTNAWELSIWKPQNFFKNFWVFKESASDLFLLSWVRVLALVMLSWLAFYFAKQDVCVRSPAAKLAIAHLFLIMMLS